MSDAAPVIPLSELATITMGQSPESSRVNGAEHGLPFLQGCAEFGAKVLTANLHCFPPLRVAKQGSILISVRAPVGTTNFADQDYCIGRGLGAVTAKQDSADSVFVFHAIEQNVGFLHRRSQGSTFLAIGSKELSALPVPALPLPTQRRIAEILSTLDETIEQMEALIAKYQQIKAGLMHDLFTRGVTPEGKLRPTRAEAPQLYKESPLAWIPKEWEVVELGNEIAIAHGFAFSGEFFADSPPGEILLTPGNFHRDGGLYFTRDNTKYFQGAIPPETVLTKGDLVTVMTDLSPQTLILGRFAIIETPLVLLHNQRIGKITLKREESWDRNFLCSALNSDRLRRKIIVEATGTTVRHTSPARILKNYLARPKFEEQRRATEILYSVERRLSGEEDTRLKAKQQKHGLMHDLLTGRVRVKVAGSEAD